MRLIVSYFEAYYNAGRAVKGGGRADWEEDPSRVVAAFWLDWGEIGVVQGVLVCGLRTGQDPCGVVWVSVTAVTWRKHVSVIEKNLNVLVAL